MTPRELGFLVRQGTPEAEILKEVTERKLLAPISIQAEEALKQGGASEALIQFLKNPQIILTSRESLAEQQRQMAAKQRAIEAAESDRAMVAAKAQSEAAAAARKDKMETMRRALAGNLIRLDGDQLRPFDEKEAKEVRVFAVYYSSVASLESRRFTPKLIESYQRLKKLYPNKFELIWVSCDRDEFNMGLHMRTMHMPWPAARFGAARETFERFAGSSMPWLVAVADTGEPLTSNAVSKEACDPDKVVEAIEYLLAQIK